MKLKLFALLLLPIISCDTGTNQEKLIREPVKPTRTLNAAFVIVDGVYNSELVAPMDVLHHTVFHTDPGINVFTVAPSKQAVTTFEGLRIIPDYDFNSDSIPAIDILIVPSAEHSMDTDLEDEALTNFISTVGQQASYIMSLCDGAFVLANAGLLESLECTTFPTDIQRFREMFPSLTVHEGVSFVRDGKAITSAGGAKSYDPALFLVEHLYGEKVAVGIGKGLVIDWDKARVKYVETNK